MNLARAGRPSIPLYGSGVLAMSMMMVSVWKFFWSLNVTGSEIFPNGRVTFPFTPWNAPVYCRRDSGIYSVARTFAVSRLRLEPLSTNIFVTRKLWMMGDMINGRVPTPTMLDGWSVGGVEITTFSSRRNLLYALLEGGREDPPWIHPTTLVISWNLPLLTSGASWLLTGAAS